MRPTREGKVAPWRPGLVYRGIGIDPDVITEDPPPPTDRASLGQAYIPFLVTGDAELVQSKWGSGPGATTVTVTLDSAPGIGNVLVAIVTAKYDGGPTYSLNNGTWTQVGSTVYSGNSTNWPLRMFRQTVDSGTSTATTVTVTGGTSNGAIKVAIVELAGVDTVDADIGSATNTATTTDTITPSAGLPAVIISGTATRNGSSPELSPAGSMVELAEFNAGFDSPMAINYQEIASTTGSYTVGSTGASANSSMIAAAFEDTGDSIIWVSAPLTIDDNDATFHFVLEEGIDAADDVLWRSDLGDTYLIGSIAIRIGVETAGANTITVQAGNEADYSDAVTIATIPFTATGTYTAQDIADSWDPTAVYRYWQLVLTTTSNVNVYEVELLDAETGGGGGVTDHEDLTGRDAADQHPADSVEYDNAGSGLTATEVQAAIDEVVLTVDDGTTSVSPVNSIVFDGATVTDDTGGQVTVEITGGGGSGTAFVGVRGARSATQSISDSTWTAVSFTATDTFDTDAFHDPGGANPSRFTVPAGLGGKYLVTAFTVWENPSASSEVHIALAKGGTRILHHRHDPATGSAFTLGITDVVELAAGEYMECHVYQDNAGNTAENISTGVLAGGAYLAMYKLEPAALGTPPGASVYKSSDQLNLTAATPAKVTFDSTYYDTDAYFDNANDRFVVPAGMSGKYLVSGVVVFTGYGATSTGAQAQVRINGVSSSTSERWFFREDLLGSAGEMDVPFAMMLHLVAGDYVEIWVNPGSRSDVDIRSLLFMTNFAITRIGGSEQTGQGTAFPSGPATSQRFFRTDLGMEFYYDGTRWLSTQVFTLQPPPKIPGTTTTSVGDHQAQITATLSSAYRFLFPQLLGGSNIWWVSWKVAFNVGAGTALDASNKWVATLVGANSAGGSTGTQGTFTIDSGANSTFREQTLAIGAAAAASTLFYLITWTKTGTPGPLQTGEQLTYRIIAT